MACKFVVSENGNKIRCKKMSNTLCPYQRWCTNERIYKSTASGDKCKYYEDGQPQKTE